MTLTALAFIYPQLAPLLTFWTSLSTEALVCFLAGGGLVAVSFASAAFLPSLAGRVAPARRILFAVGAGLIVFASIWQTAIGIGVHREQVSQLQLIAQAERIRAEKAEAVTTRDRAQKSRDDALIATLTGKLKEMNRDLDQDPDADRVVLPRADARRLRDAIRGAAR